MLNLANSIHVNTRAESLSFAFIFSSMVLNVLGQLVYFLSLEYHTDYQSLCIVSEKHFLQTDLEV